MSSRITPKTCLEANRTGATASPKQEDIAIAEKLRVRDPQILDQLILQYQHRLLRYLLYLTGSRELSEDLIQETWMRVMARGEQFRGESQFVTWLFSIARNLVLDLRRRRWFANSMKEVTMTVDGRPMEIPSAAQSPFERYAQWERGELIASTLLMLSPPQREVVVLHFLEELPLKEIARLTGVPLSTTKARLYRAVLALRSRASIAEHPAARLKSAIAG